MPLLLLVLATALVGPAGVLLALRHAPALSLRSARVAALVGMLLVAVLGYLQQANDTLLDTDAGVERWAHAHATPASSMVLRAVTQLGDSRVIALLGLVLVLVAMRRLRSAPLTALVVSVVVGNQLATTALKGLFDRARPTLNPFADTLGPSFPSGHTSGAAAFYAVAALVLAYGRSGRTRALLTGGAIGIAVAVAATRVLLDDHWLSDVVAGLALGWAWFCLCAIALGSRLEARPATSERAPRVGSARRTPRGSP